MKLEKEKMDMIKIGNKLLYRRSELELSKEDLSQIFEYTPKDILLMESGNSLLKYEAEKLLILLDIVHTFVGSKVKILSLGSKIILLTHLKEIYGDYPIERIRYLFFEGNATLEEHAT
jgi:hypothetical protein